MPDVAEVRIGRNYVRVGDVVRVLRSAPNKRDAFDGTVATITANDQGDVTHLWVTNPAKGYAKPYPLKRIQRRAQTGAKADTAKAAAARTRELQRTIAPAKRKGRR